MDRSVTGHGYQPPLTTIISTPCLLHKASVINNFSIKKCTHKYYNGIWYHVIYLSEAKELESLTVGITNSIHFRHNESNKVSEIWEHLTAKPICSLYTLEHDCSSKILKELVSKLVQCICQLTLQEIVDQTLISGSGMSDMVAKFFLTNIATVAESNGSFSFYLLNRFTLKSVKHVSNKHKLRLLKKQLFMILPLVKCFYFTKKNSSNRKQETDTNGHTGHNKYKLNDMCKNCTLLGYTARYMHANIQELHAHFCIVSKGTNKMQILLNMGSSINILNRAIQAVIQLEANTTTAFFNKHPH